MKTRMKVLYAAISLSVILTAYFCGYYAGLQNSTFIRETYGPTGHLSVLVEKHDGAYDYENHNIVVTIGKKRLRDFLGWANATGPNNATQYMSLSNDATPLASWTKLPNEITGTGLARATGTVSCINATAYQVQHKWTATGDVTCQCGGLHWSPDSDSDNNLWAAATFTQTSLSNNENITLTWTVNHA